MKTIREISNKKNNMYDSREIKVGTQDMCIMTIKIFVKYSCFR